MTQKGSGAGDGVYQHASQSMGVILEVVSDWDRKQWRFARLFSSEYDDLVAWYDVDDKHRFGVW